MIRDTNRRLHWWPIYLFYLVPLMVATYIAMVLVPAASVRWPARFLSWQELSLLGLVILLSAGSARPLYRLRHNMAGRPAGISGVSAVLSVFAMVGGAAALLLHSSPWVVGAFLIGAALPPLVSGMTAHGGYEPGRRFNL